MSLLEPASGAFPPAAAAAAAALAVAAAADWLVFSYRL